MRSISLCPTRIDRNPVTHYVAVRKDLPLGLLAAQVAHAAGESSPGGLSSGTHAVVLGVLPADLSALVAKLEAAGVPHAAIYEDTAPYTDQLLAVGIAPGPKASLKRYVSEYPLLRKEDP